jgi:hypothetical protein
VKGVLLGLAIAGWILACGAPKTTQDCARGSQCWAEQERAEILALWTQIRTFRRDAHMDLDPTPSDVMQMTSKTVKELKQICPDGHNEPTACSDICSLGHNICDNAESICRIADELGKSDDFAQQKCTSAKASCHEAEQRCCDCSANPANKDDPK